MMPIVKTIIACCVLPGLSACTDVHVRPIKVEPMHVTVDVNVKIDKELRDAPQQP